MPDFKAPPPPPSDFGAPVDGTPVEIPSSVDNNPNTNEVLPPDIETPQEQGAHQQGSSNTPPPPPGNVVQQNLAKLQEQKAILQEKFNGLQQTKKLALVAVGVFVIGLLFGMLLSGGEEAPQPQKGLQGVISNPDITKPLPRCGQQDSPSSPCILYIMNHHTYDKVAKDFFPTATTLTNRNDYLLSSENLRYGTMRIPPGYFAQIKIPALK